MPSAISSSTISNRAGMLASHYDVPGVGATTTGRNGGGDPYFTDGMATIGVLRQAATGG